MQHQRVGPKEKIERGQIKLTEARSRGIGSAPRGQRTHGYRADADGRQWKPRGADGGESQQMPAAAEVRGEALTLMSRLKPRPQGKGRGVKANRREIPRLRSE
jgi:hypothetical protein